MRLFVGVVLGATAHEACVRRIAPMVAAHPRALRLIPRGSAHVTLAFCAEVPEMDLQPLVRAVTAVSARVPPFEIGLQGLLALPPGSHPRLLAADVPIGAANIRELSSAIVDGIRGSCPALALAPSTSPHVTLARFRKQAPKAESRAVLRSLADEAAAAPVLRVRVDHLDVVKSTLTPAGPVYDVLHHLRLFAA